MAIQLKPCGRCERELPPVCYAHKDDMFCKECTREINRIIAQKYNTIEAAVMRAKIRRRTRSGMNGNHKGAVAKNA